MHPFRRYAPKSLYGRILLIVVLPIFIMQSLVTYLFFDRHWDRISASLSNNVAGQIALIARLYDEYPDEEARKRLRDWAADDLDISIRFSPTKTLPATNNLSPFNVYNIVLERRLEIRLDQPFFFDTRSYRDQIEVRVVTSDGQLVFLALKQRAFATTGAIFLFWLAATTLSIVLIALVFMRRQVRSILKLATAAEAFGRGRDMPAFRPEGATEVRKAGFAFIAMRARIARHLEQRTSMLASVSHDLRTPLTRIKLALAMQPENKEIDELKGDVSEMEKMLDAYLDFARKEASDEKIETFDIAEMIREIGNDVKREGRHLSTRIPGPVQLTAHRSALKRAITNLVSNALKYAANSWISLEKHEAKLVVFVDDDGPGIAEADYEAVFKPFHRLDASRSQDIAGVGMGLTIARDIVSAHGGEIQLSKSPRGGLRSTISLPVEITMT